MGFKQEIVQFIPWLVAAYAVICVAAYFGNRQFMYFPDPTRTAPTEASLDGVNEVEITVADGITLVAWHAPAKEDKPTILYFHGNAANAANRAPKIRLSVLWLSLQRQFMNLGSVGAGHAAASVERSHRLNSKCIRQP